MASTGRPASPWAEYVKQRVRGGPVPYLDALVNAAALVPPGRAYRHGLGQRRYVRKTRDTQVPERVFTKDETIRLGQRDVAARAIKYLARVKRVEVYDDDGVKMVRVGPNTLT